MESQIPRFIAPPDYTAMSNQEAAEVLQRLVQETGFAALSVTVPYSLAERAATLLRQRSSPVPTQRQLSAAILAYEYAIPETAQPTAAQRMEAMNAALTAALRESE